MLRVNRSIVIRFGLVVVLLVSVAVACTSASSSNRRLSQSGARPNIVFVLTDDLSDNLIKYMPHVSALMQQGTSFSHYFVVDSLCCPSRSAIFTGQYPHTNGVFRNHGPDGGYPAFNRNGNEPKTFGAALQKSGYRTGFLGKYLNDYVPSDGVPQGWDEWDVTGSGYGEFNYNLNQNGIVVPYGHDPEDYLTDVVSDRAGEFIDDAARHTKPFALEVATFAPHLPAVPAPRDQNTFPALQAPRDATYNRLPTNPLPWLQQLPPLSAQDDARDNLVFRKRVESVQAVDDMIGHLEQRLEANGLAKNTYFVFSSDNGFHIGNYRMLPGKQTAFDTDIKVPLVVTGPGVPAGHTVDAMTTSIDLAPTFEQIGHATPTDDPDGVSLLDLWHGDRVPPDWQQAVLVEHHGHDFYPGDPDRQPIRSGNPPTYEAIRTPDATYVEYLNGEREYYDLRNDPLELHNLAPTASPAVLARLHETLQAMENCTGAAQCQDAARTV